MVKRDKTISLNDALRSAAPPAFNTMVKPMGSACNLGCSYCYYLDKADTVYQGKQPKMSLELLEEYTRQYIEANEIPEVTFVWHGGEPLMAGIDFYRKAIEFQRKYAGGKKIVNTLQTNGTLVNDDWCRLFHDNGFLIGISIDGPRDIHDAFRTTRAGAPTFEKVIHAITLMIKHRVEYNTLSVVNNLSEGRGAEVYGFLKSMGSRYMQFLPAVEYVARPENTGKPFIVKPGTPGSRKASWSVSALGYGKFLTDIFDVWVRNDVGTYFVQAFDMTLTQWVGAKPGMCIYSETCGDALVVEHNGDVFSCDHFVYPEYRLGNIMETHLRDLYKSPAQFAFGINKRNTLPAQCLKCRYYFACRGECPKHRFMKSASGEDNLNVLCEGFKLYFSHVEPYMDEMKRLLLNKMAPANIMEWTRSGKQNSK
ncbi:MAG: anaerobic sulfatase-maturation protein [Bacteroidales bacterium]|nr:anaerobic sulfatase-maturation protein [Bacteroidales bacterium]